MVAAIKWLADVGFTINAVAAIGMFGLCLVCPVRELPAFSMMLANAFLETALCSCLLVLCWLGEAVIASASQKPL